MAQSAIVVSLRDRNRVKKREALVGAAFELFEAQGFESTTVDQIAAAAEVSRRTFFRYFACKEEVVFPEMQARLEAFHEALAAEGEPMFRVRSACLAMAQEFEGGRDDLLRQQRLVQTSPALMTFDREQDLAWEVAIAEVLRDGRRTQAARRKAQIWAGAIMGAVRASLRSWFDSDGQGDLVSMGREALDYLQMGMAAAMQGE